MDREERLDMLYHKKKRFNNNKNLCLIAIMFIVFSMFSNIVGAPIYYIVGMSLIILGLIAVSIYGNKLSKEVSLEIDQLESQMEAEQNIDIVEVSEEENLD